MLAIPALGTKAGTVDALAILRAARDARRGQQVALGAGPTVVALTTVVNAPAVGTAIQLARRND